MWKSNGPTDSEMVRCGQVLYSIKQEGIGYILVIIY